MKTILEDYVADLFTILKEAAAQQKLEADQGKDVSYNEGWRMGLLQAMAFMQSQADSFGLPRAILGLDEKDVL